MLSFPHQKIVEATVIFLGVCTAEFRAMFVDGATSLFLVKEATDALINRVFTVTEYTVTIGAYKFGKASLCHLVIELKALREAFNIEFRDQNPLVSTAIAGTF